MLKGVAIGLALGFLIGWIGGNANGINIAHSAEAYCAEHGCP